MNITPIANVPFHHNSVTDDSLPHISSLTFCSYNLHGLTQGLPVLQFLSNRHIPPHFILVQESWLTPANLYKINNFSSLYSSFGISGMEKAVRKGILRGRPFSGQHILVKSELCKFITHINCDERFVIIVFQNIVILNVYLPSVVSLEDECRLVELLTTIQDALEVAIASVKNPILITGGDFNLDFDSNSRSAVLLHEFRRKRSLSLCNKIINCSINYSYHHETLQQRSLIDYFLVPDSCWLKNYEILDLPFNLSDHLVVEISIQCCLNVTEINNKTVAPSTPKNNFLIRDWNPYNKQMFYEKTRCNFTGIAERIAQVSADCNEFIDSNEVENCIDIIYSDAVEALLVSAKDTVPIIKSNLSKPWWNDELNKLKGLSIITHKAWIDAGRPSQGAVFIEKQKAKSDYKKRIAENKNNTQNNLTESLQNRLLDNDQTNFWKIWKKKFGSKIKVTNCIEGLSDATCIANRFADTFAKTCRVSPANRAKADLDLIQFKDRLANYKGAPIIVEDIVNIECTQEAVNSFSNGKAAGYDMLTAEHLKYCHPVVLTCLTKLFALMLKFSYVPTAFGIGITVPLLKADVKGSTTSCDSYRGITILPIISKLFEIMLSKMLDPYLKSCNSQFGFKQGSSCSHAIYTVRKTVEHFTSLNSTVNLCALDISKAFDKINHIKLFNKLMDRNVPLNCILILICWYDKSSVCVRWEDSFSYFIKLETGVRQGSTLSPKLFALFVNELLICLKSSNLGCYIKGICFNSVMFADDLLILSLSITHLQRMINICYQVLSSCHLELNSKKSSCLRIGPRHSFIEPKLILNGQELAWKSELKYLGVFIVSSNKFKCSLQNNRQKFFQATNSIFGKIGTRAPLNLTLSLIDLFCVPVLLYGLEVINQSKSERNTLDFIYSTVFHKLFQVKEKNNIKLCQFFSGCLPSSCRIDIRKLNFFNNLKLCQDSLPRLLLELDVITEYSELMNRYDIPPDSSAHTFKYKVFKRVEEDLELNG